MKNETSPVRKINLLATAQHRTGKNGTYWQGYWQGVRHAHAGAWNCLAGKNP